MKYSEEIAFLHETEIRVDILPIVELDSAMFDELASLLDECERARAAKFHFERHRREFIAAHGLKRKMLSAAAPAFQPQEWEFHISPTGKPEVVQIPELKFNLTHCEGLVACTTGQRVLIGLDAESLHRSFPDELIDIHFSAAERSWLAPKSSRQRTDACFDLWTLKEAWAKASGMGLLRPLSQASFESIHPISVTFDPETGEDSAAWHFRRWRLGTHVVSLSWRGQDQELRCRIFSARDSKFTDLFCN